MKAFIKVILLFVIIFSIVLMFGGCSDNLSTNNYSQQTSSVNQEKPFIFNIPQWLIFGMKEGDIRSHYSIEPSTYKNILYYDSYDLADKYKDEMSYRVLYGMSNDNKLISLTFQIEIKDYIEVNKRQYLAEYESLKNELIKTFGEPKSSVDKWVNEKYKNDELMKNTAIEKGEYTILTLWEKEGNYVSLRLDKYFNINYTNDKTEWY